MYPNGYPRKSESHKSEVAQLMKQLAIRFAYTLLTKRNSNKMNSKTDYDTDNNLGQSIDDLYGYEERVLSPALFSTDVVLTVPSCTSPTAQDYPPMPKERLARKQRSFGRRGGADHSALLKSAVLASLSFTDGDSDDDACGGPRRSSVASFATTSDDGTQGPPSPRKRARFDDEDEEENEELAIERASELFESMCVDLSVSEKPARRVSRRTSSELFEAMCADLSESEKPVRRVSRRTSYDGDDASPSTTCGLGDTRTDC
jgi:hypothetical protein